MYFSMYYLYRSSYRRMLRCRTQGAIDAARLQNNIDNNLKNNLKNNEGSRQINGEVDGVRDPSGGDLLRQMVATSDGGSGRLGNRMAFSDNFITRQVMR